MNKIAIAADLHLNNNPYGKIMDDLLPLKIHDNFLALDFFVDKCIEEGVCRAFFVGDVFDSPAPSSKVRRLLNKRIQKLVWNNIEVVMLVGNHDSYMEHHALEPLIGWTRKLKIIEETGVEGYGDSNVCFVYIPHTRKIENKETTFKEYVDKLKCNMSKLKDKRVILFGHFGVFGALRNDSNTNKTSEDVSVIDLESLNCEICFLGDYHKRQKISKTKEIWYVGSMERQDFSEMNQDKGFCIYDIDDKQLEWVNYAARKMIVLECNGLPEVLSSVQTSDLKDSVVKIRITGLQEFFDVQQRFNEIASMVREKEAMFFAGLEKPKPEEHKSSIPIESIDSDSIDLYKIVESEIEEISKRDSEY